MAQCKATTDSGKQCEEVAVNGDYCEKYHNEGGGDNPSPTEPKGGGGPSVIETGKNAAGLVYFATRIYEFLRDNWPEFFFSAEQVATYQKLKQQKSDASAQDVFSEFLAGLTKEQWARVIAAFGIALLVEVSKKSTAKESLSPDET